MADSTLAAIRTKVRRLTRSPSEALITTTEIDEYINTFILYDMPEHLRLNKLRTTFEFYTTPHIDRYQNNTVDSTQPLYNFKNKYITFHEPMYVDGYQAFYSQDRTQFYGIYPQNMHQEEIGTGDGVTTLFSGTLSTKPVIPGEVLFTSVDANGTGIVLKDIPSFDGVTGEPLLTGDLVTPDQTAASSVGTINYQTGVFSFTFPTAPDTGEQVLARTQFYAAGRPYAILFYDTYFVLRPVPDKVYKVSMEAYIRPTELANSGDIPELEQWFQYISYGAAKKIYEDRTDMEGVAMLMPEFKKQETLALRRTLQLQSNDRSATIYTEQSGLGSALSGYWYRR